jgi:hypothetical protein
MVPKAFSRTKDHSFNSNLHTVIAENETIMVKKIKLHQGLFSNLCLYP